MSADVEQLKVVIDADTKSAESGLDSVGKKSSETAGKLKGFIGQVGSWVAAIGITNLAGDAFGFLKDQIVDSVKVAEQYQIVQSQLAQGLKSTHDASGETVQSLEDLADKYSKITTYSKAAIEQSESISLTFTNIGKDIFPQATMAAEDLATRMGEDLPNATLELDKALGDPIKGYAQLQRVGVVFTASQVDQIKTMSKAGNVAGAQAIILKELQREFGGSAVAAGKTFAGSLQILQNQLEDTKDAVGTALLPILAQLLQAITPIAAGLMNGIAAALQYLAPLISQVAHDIGPVLGGAMDALGGKAGHIETAVTGFGRGMHAVSTYVAPIPGLFQKLGDAFQGIKDLLFGTTVTTSSSPFTAINRGAKEAAPTIQKIPGLLDKIGPVLQKIAPLAQQLAASIGQGIQTAAPIVEQFAKEMLPELGKQFQFLWNIVTTDVMPIVKDVAHVFLTTLLPAIEGVQQWVEQHLMPIIQKIADFLRTTGVPIFNTLASVFAHDILPAAEQVGSVITDKILPPLIRILSKVLPVLNPLLQLLGWILQHVVGPALSVVGNVIAGVLTGIDGLLTAAGWVKDKIGAILGAIGGFIGGIIKTALDGAIIGINQLIGLLDSIKIHVPSVSVGPVHSPSFDWNGLGIAKIPLLAQGGTILSAGWTIVGDAGPELLNLNAGAQVRPLSNSGGVAGVAGGGSVTITPGTSLSIPISINGRQFAQAVASDLVAFLRTGAGLRIQN